jgi:hypothetical protein
MPEILIFYFGGLLASSAVAVVFYYVLGGPIAALVQAVFGSRTGAVWGRASRIFMVVMVLTGALSTQWYGCDSYGDYKTIAADRRLMLQKSTDQVAGAITYGKTFVIFAAGVGAITVALLARRSDAGGHADKTTGPPR